MKVVLLGDSLRMGYQELVRTALSGKAEVWAPEDNCGSSFRLRENLQEWAIDQQPDLIHFNAGIHDLGSMPGETVPRFTTGAYVRNLRLILQRIKAGTNAQVIFATTTPFLIPCRAEVPNEQCVPATARVERYNAIALQLMCQMGVPVDDLYRAVLNHGIYRCICEDKIHMTEEGNQVLADAVVQAITPFITEG